MRVVLDTNIFVSMMMGGRTGKINDAWRAGKFTLVVSDEILSEYLEVLQRPKLHLSSHAIAIVIGRVSRKAEFVTPQAEINAITADPTDNKFLEAAFEGKAELIVSGDSHLLELESYREISIITAREFAAQLESQ
jgi:putative PIN family toxin of toxin-antitoxin system